MTHPGSAVTYGPSPGEGFIVLEGIAVVVGLGRTFTICAGGCWPGTGPLPPELFGALRPSEVIITPGTRLSHHPQSPREIEFALSSLRAQLLRSGRTDDRLDMLEDTLGTLGLNRVTMAAILDVSRESVCHGVSRARKENANAAD